MDAAPKVSVIIPVYNTEQYLRECLDSVVNQTLKDIEIICVDDGSTDNCGAICDEYDEKDSRIRVIHQENRGQGYARNVEVDQAGGKYIIFLDSDDYWVPSTLEALYAEAERNQTQVLAFGAMPFGDVMNEMKLHPAYQHTVQTNIVKSGPEYLKVALKEREYYASPCLRFYLLEYLKKIGIHFDEGIIHEDNAHSFFAVLFADRVECIAERFYQRRYRPGSTMTSKSIRNSAHGYRVALDSLLDAYENRPLSALGREQLARYIMTRIDLIYNLFRQDRKTAASIQRDVRKTLKRARVLPSLPRSRRLATYSLFIEFYVHKVYKKFKRLLRK